MDSKGLRIYEPQPGHELLRAASIDKRKIHMKLKEYHLKLEPQGYVSGTCLSTYTMIRSFFSHNDDFLGRMPKAFRAVTKFASRKVMSPSDVPALIMTASSIR